jgi:hypothetical protein
VADVVGADDVEVLIVLKQKTPFEYQIQISGSKKQKNEKFESEKKLRILKPSFGSSSTTTSPATASRRRSRRLLDMGS